MIKPIEEKSLNIKSLSLNLGFEFAVYLPLVFETWFDLFLCSFDYKSDGKQSKSFF